MTKIGVQRLTDEDMELLTVALKAMAPSWMNTSEPVLLAVRQRQRMILDKLEQEIEERSKQ